LSKLVFTYSNASSFYVFECQFSHYSILGTYTIGVPHTLKQTDSDMTLSRSYDQGEITKMMEDNYGRLMIF